MYYKGDVAEVSKIVKVSYHASGVVNYHNLSNDRIYNEPLFDVNSEFCFITYLVRDIDSLIAGDAGSEDVLLSLPPKYADAYYAFSFLIRPTQAQSGIEITFASGLFTLAVEVGIVPPPEGEAKMPFYYLTPSTGLAKCPLGQNACILFHQRLNGTSDIIIYDPNSSGIYTMIFDEQRRSIPKKEVLLKLTDPDHEAVFTSIKPHYAKFYVINKRNGARVKHRKGLIQGVTFDNRL
jgi:hypothetical protein